MDPSWPRTWPQMAELHVFDPEGDVLLILDRCLKEDDLVEPVDEEKRESAPEDGFVPESPGQWVEDEPPPIPADVLDWPELELESATYEPQAEIPEVDDMTKLETSASAFSTNQEAKPRVEKVQMRASSKHLILASPTFRTSLGSGTYSEGRILQIEGNIVVPLPDEDPDAMIILLNIIHGLSSKVPRRVDLNMLSRLAVVVNHRYMHEAVELWSDTWIDHLKRDEGLPGSYTPEILLPWLFIFWVFRKDEDFRSMSQILERECDDSLESEVETVYIGPYIPASIIRTIRKKRIDAIDSMIAVIHDLITKYSGPSILCDNGQEFSCDANLLGSLLKASAIIGIWPRPDDPYPGIKSKTLGGQIRGMQVLDNYEVSRRGYYSPIHHHGLRDSIEASIRSLEDRILGLHLRFFLPNTGKRS